eukprot:6580010-Pyramimonas_sp.AAC.1
MIERQVAERVVPLHKRLDDLRDFARRIRSSTHHPLSRASGTGRCSDDGGGTEGGHQRALP